MEQTCIYLVGFMGSGKTTVAKELSKQTGRPLIDTDEALVEREGRSIPEIFDISGEAYFRKLETEVLRQVSKEGDGIISCGGGVAMKEENRRIMHTYGRTVLLMARPETILERVQHDDNRPLLKGKKNVEAIRELMDERMLAYRQAADLIVDVDGKRPEDIAEEILGKINNI